LRHYPCREEPAQAVTARRHDTVAGIAALENAGFAVCSAIIWCRWSH